MPIDYEILKSELLNDPLEIGYSNYIDLGNDQGLADSLNNKIYPKQDYFPISSLESYVDSMGLRLPIELAAVNSDMPDVVRYPAIMTLNIFKARYNNVDVSLPAFQLGMSGLLAGGIISSGDVYNINQLSYITISRSEVLFGSDLLLQNSDISKALRNT